MSENPEALSAKTAPPSSDVRGIEGGAPATAAPLTAEWSPNDAATDVELVALRDALLSAILPNVVFDGWSARALKDGAANAGLDEIDVVRAFPGGPADAVAHFSAWADREMLKALATMDMPAMKVRRRVAEAVKARLTALEPHRDAIRRAIAFSALPAHCALGPKTLHDTADIIWFAAGDTATDFNFHSKRMLLAGVLAATTLYWLEDASEECAETWSFLDRRISDVLSMGKALGTVGASVDKVSRVLGGFPNPARFVRRLREAGRAVAGGLDTPGHPSA